MLNAPILTMFNRTSFHLVALALLFPLAVQAADWPQFRGPNRDGIWNETGILKSFPAEGVKIRWRVPVGPGWSSPVVARGRVYLTDMRLEKPRAWERIQCFQESNGKLLWSHASELFTDEGNLILARLTPGGYREISRVHLLKPTADLATRKFAWTPPAFANGRVFARNYEDLICASLAAKP
jgi:outer membrane protein assembly factor BamB